MESTLNSSVMVSSGQRLHCESVVRQVSLTVQGYDLSLDLYVLPMHDVDIVLGAA